MGCGVSTKSLQYDIDVLNSARLTSLDNNQSAKSVTAGTSSNEALNMSREGKASMKDDGDSTLENKDETDAERTLQQKIRSFLHISEDATKEALALSRKYPDIQDEFSHMVNIMHDAVKKNHKEFVKQLMGIRGHNEVTIPDVVKDLIHFLALIGGAEATVEVYAEQLRSMNVTYVTDQLLADVDMYEQHESAMFVVTLMREFWERATDSSLEFGGHLAETSLLSYMAEDLKNLEENFSADSSVFDGSLTILHNCARNRQTKQRFRDIGAVELLTPFLARQEKEIKLLSLLTLSYIIDEEDNHLLFADASDFDFLLDAVALAWEDGDHRDPSGYTLAELLQGLGNLAQNDDNKKLLMSKDVTELLKPILETGSDAEKQEAAQIMWNLAFDKDIRSKMENDKGLLARLEKLKHSIHKGVAKSCSGVLWVLNMDKKVHHKAELKGCPAPPGSSKPPPAPPTAGFFAPPPMQPATSPADGQVKGHIMISYQWGNQKVLMQIRNSLRSQGFRLRMDIDNISGSTLQAMAEAVEKADAVLMCMSQRYKDSLNCRTEAEYAFAMQKPIIPLLMENNYKPDGWLGILKGSKLFFDFSGKYPYEKKLEELVKELGERGRTDVSEVDGPIRAEKVRPVASSPAVINVISWSQKDVHSWLNKHQLSGCSKLQNLSGENLKFLQKLSHRAPEFFFLYLKQDLGLTSLNHMMHFSDAIDSLP